MPEKSTYKIVRSMGRRLCYRMFEVRQPKGESTFHLKLFDKEIGQDEKVKKHLLDSIRMLTTLSHPNLCRIYDFGETQGSIYIVSEASKGRMLANVKVPISFEKAARLAKVIGKALSYCHAHGVIHGLLHPGSIYLTRDNVVKVDDLGLWVMAPYLVRTTESEDAAISRYLAPEVLRKTEQADGRADIFSLGAIFYELLSGFPIGQHSDTDSLHEFYKHGDIPKLAPLRPELPEDIDRFLAKSLAHQPEKRFVNMKAFREGLVFLKKHTLPLELPHSNTIPAAPRRWPYGVASILAVAVIAVILLWGIPDVRLQLFGKNSATRLETRTSSQSSAIASPDKEAPLPENSTSAPDESLIKTDDTLIADSNLAASLQSSAPLTPSPSAPPATELSVVPVRKPVRKKPTPAATATVTVIVAADNEPLETDIFVNNLYRARTDHAGELTLRDLQPGQLYRITVIKPGFESMTKELLLRNGVDASVLTFNLK